MQRTIRTFISLMAVILLSFTSLVGASANAALPDWMEFWKDDEYQFNGGFFDPPRETHELINAVDQHGEPFSFADHEGKVIFVYFGYTYCPDACPATLAEWREVKAELGDDADDVVFVMVSVDPERDTPERLKEWMSFWDESFYGVSMSPEDTATVTQEWGISWEKVDSGSAGGYTVNHDTSTYVIDPQGQLWLTYPLGFAPEDIAEDVRHLRDGD